MNWRRLTALLALLGAVALVATACGRRPSDLDTPYEAEDQKKTPLPPEPQKPEKDKRFFLDGLID
jgi:cell division septation protein DedD